MSTSDVQKRRDLLAEGIADHLLAIADLIDASGLTFEESQLKLSAADLREEAKSMHDR